MWHVDLGLASAPCTCIIMHHDAMPVPVPVPVPERDKSVLVLSDVTVLSETL
jgi:hypothetical protein